MNQETLNLLIVGGSGGTNIGASFFRATEKLKIESGFINTASAYKGLLPQWINWHLRNKYPCNLDQFSNWILEACARRAVGCLLTTGIAPISSKVLQTLGGLGVYRLNFLTDNPWNSAHKAKWFLHALPHYDIVFSPRRTAIDDLLKAGCYRVEYLPFGYDSDLFYPELSRLEEEATEESDIVFAGGADRDRIPYISTLIKAGFSVDLYGSYWERYPETKHITKGQADVPTLRRAIQNAKIALCIVRHANRDGHCMRTFEVPAIGTCMLTEDTQEHREIFGPEGEAVIYFKTLSEMVEKAHWLLTHEIERQRLAQTAHRLITQGGHTYADRLKTILSLANQS